MSYLKRIAPTLVLAAGIFGATALAVMARQSAPPLLPAGPLLLALSILLAKFIEQRALGVVGGWKRTLGVAATCLVAGLAVTWFSPKWIGEVIALFGAMSFTVLNEPLKCFSPKKVSY